MGTGRGKKREQDLEKKADAAIAQWQPSPLEAKQNERVTKFLGDWDSGKDVRDMDYLRPFMNLYDSAVSRQTDERGMGLMGGNALSGSSPHLSGLIAEQLKSRRMQDASGQLYNTAVGAYSDATNTQVPFLTQLAESRAGGKAGLANQQYTAYLNRPKKPSIWEQLLGGAMQMGASYVGGL